MATYLYKVRLLSSDDRRRVRPGSPGGGLGQGGTGDPLHLHHTAQDRHQQSGDLFGRVATIRRSKAAAGHRTIPLNRDAMAALARLLERAQALGSREPNTMFSPPARNVLLIPRVRRRTGARRGASRFARLPGASAERPHNERSILTKVYAERSQRGNEAARRSAIYGSTTSATKPLRKWRKPARPTPR